MTKAVDEFINSADRRFTALHKIVDTQRGEIVELSRAFGDLAERYARQHDRIGALEAELARVQNIAFNPWPKVESTQSKPVRNDGAGATREEQHPIISQVATLPGVMPTSNEKRKLLAIVGAKHIALAGVALEDFSSCFDFIAVCSRKDKLDTQTAPADWLDQCARHSRNWSVTLNGLIAAAISHNDISYTYSPDRAQDASFSLLRHGPNTGTGAWRKLLEGSPVRDPLPGPKLDYSIGMVREIRAQ